MSRRILVTGGTGFLGSHLVRALVSGGDRVFVLARPAGKHDRLADIASQVSYCAGDVADQACIEAAFHQAEPEIVFHLASNTAARRFAGGWAEAEHANEVNLHGTLNVVRAASLVAPRLRCFIRTGSLEEYGTGPTPADEAQRERPSSPYSASQTAATHWCQMLQPHLSFPLVTLRPALIYGPGQSADFLIPALIESLLAGRRFATSEGNQTRDLIYVGDVVAALLRAGLTEGLSGAVINISTGQRHRIRDVVAQIGRLLGREDLVDRGSASPRIGDLDDLCGRNALAEKLLGWRPETSLAEGLSMTVAWYRERPLILSEQKQEC